MLICFTLVAASKILTFNIRALLIAFWAKRKKKAFEPNEASE